MSINKDLRNQQVIQWVIILAGLLLIINIAQLQLFDSSYKEQAARTTLFKKTHYPSRGLIFDRNRELLVVNDPIYELQAIYNDLNPELDTAKFCQLLNIDEKIFINNINKDWSSPRYRKSLPFTFLTRIDAEVYAKFQEHLHEFKGFYPVVRNIRRYPHGSAAHALGYIGEVDQRTIDVSAGKYAAGDYIGVSGVEKTYEDYLRGSKGVSYVLKDNLGREVGPFANGKMDSLAISGNDFISSIDLALQSYGEKLFQNKRGGLVAIEPSTGEILSIISAPSYDPNQLAINKDRGKAFASLLSDTLNKPFMDRAVMAKYPPGSIFKPILSLIALQEEVTYASRSIPCPGYYKYSSFKYGCHSHIRCNNISMAIQHSCNTYFFQLIRDMVEKYDYNEPGRGLDLLVRHLADFGLGHSLGVDHLHENNGFIPDSKYYDNVYKKEVNGWKSTYIMSIGIGQGEMELTTMQMANLAAILANRGYYFIPHLVKSIESSEYVLPSQFKEKISVNINPAYFPYVIDGMENVVIGGTARIAAIPGISVCGKTGTSQNPHGEDHSVFFAFAPKENPKIAIAVFVENAGWGGSYAAPIASLMMEKYLTGDISKQRKWLEERMLAADLITNP